jgi:hypothetical protein
MDKTRGDDGLNGGYRSFTGSHIARNRFRKFKTFGARGNRRNIVRYAIFIMGFSAHIWLGIQENRPPFS